MRWKHSLTTLSAHSSCDWFVLECFVNSNWIQSCPVCARQGRWSEHYLCCFPRKDHSTRNTVDLVIFWPQKQKWTQLYNTVNKQILYFKHEQAPWEGVQACGCIQNMLKCPQGGSKISGIILKGMIVLQVSCTARLVVTKQQNLLLKALRECSFTWHHIQRRKNHST